MPTYRIYVVNRHFKSDQEIDALNLDTARIEALKGALLIGVDEVCDGKMFFGAQISIECDNEEPERLMIAVGATPLQ